MDCKITSTRQRSGRRAAGMLLAEALVAIGIAGVLVLVVCAFWMYSSQTFAALFNYVDLDDANRNAIDILTRDVRQANRVKACSADGTSLVLEDADGSDISYIYDPGRKTLTRTKNGVSQVLLRECRRLTFNIRQRNVVGGSYDVYPAATPDTAKLVDVSWLCAHTILGRLENTESVQTARIVIRKQGT